MNLRQKEKPDFRTLSGLKSTRREPAKLCDDNLNSGTIPSVSLITRFDLSRTAGNLNAQMKSKHHRENQETQFESVHQTEIPALVTSDEKLKMICKVHVVNCNFDDQQNLCSTSCLVDIGNSGNANRQNHCQLVESQGISDSETPDEIVNRTIACSSSFTTGALPKTNKNRNTGVLQHKSVLCDQLISDPKYKTPCKVHILKCNIDKDHQNAKNQDDTYNPDNAERQNNKQSLKCKDEQMPTAINETVTGTNGNETIVDKSKTSNPNKQLITDPKLKFKCKVHVVRLAFDEHHHVLHSKLANQRLPNSNAIYKVSVKEKKHTTAIKSKQQKATSHKDNGLLNCVNQSTEIDNLDKEKELAYPKQQTILNADKEHVNTNIHTDGLVRNDSGTQPNSNTCDSSALKCNQTTVHAPCHPDCGHSNIIKSNEFNGVHVDMISNNKLRDKGTEIKESKKTVTRKKNIKKLPLKDQNEIIPRRKAAKKKAAPNIATESVPQVVVEKCTDRVPVYKKLDENTGNSLRKSNPYEFSEIDSDTSNAVKPVKRRRRVGVRNKKQNANKLIYDKCIKQIMNKLAITIQSNKFVAKEVKSPKSKSIIPTKNIRIQTKRPKVQFNDKVVSKKPNTKVNKAANLKINNLPILDTEINTVSSNAKNKLGDENNTDNGNIKNTTENKNLNDVPKQNVKDISNKLLNNGMQRKYINHKALHRAMNPKRLFDQQNQEASTSKQSKFKENEKGLTGCPDIFTKQSSKDNRTRSRPGSACSAVSEDMFDTCNVQDDLPAVSGQELTSAKVKHSTPWSISSEHGQVKQADQQKTNGMVIQEDLDLSFASQISINRSGSACSGETSEHSHSNSVAEHIADDDPYFGFVDDNGQQVQQPDKIVTSKPVYQHLKKRLPALQTARKTDSPWRYSPRNISFNPHFLRLNAKALPVINQDPVLDCTFDENIKKQHPNLTVVEPTETPHKRSPVQKSILDYVTSNVVANRENIQRVSIFNDEEFSPIKLTSTNSPTKSANANKAKRNILGALTNNIIVHSVITISTPQKKHADQIESPNLSVIFDEVKNDHALVKKTTTRLQTLRKGDEVLISSDDQENICVKPLDNHGDNVEENLEVVVTKTANITDVFHGFSMNHVETSKKVSNELAEFLQKQQEILDDQQKQIQVNQTLFGFETIMESENIEKKEAVKRGVDMQKRYDNAKPFRLSLRDRKAARKKESPDKKQDAEVPQLETTPEIEAAVSDSEDDFVPPTPIPEDEPLKVGLFEEIESNKPKKTYRSRKRYRGMAAEDSEEEDDRHKKKKKDQPTKADVVEFEKWAAKFNAMCEEVEHFPLEIE